MNNHKNRVGCFTSSEIVALLSNGKRDMTELELFDRPKKGKGSKTTTVEDPAILGEAAMTYVQSCNWERRLGRSLSAELYSKPTSWGSLVERYVMSKPELIGLEYTQRPDEPIVHPKYDWYSGSPDMTKKETVCELKCPFTLISFCQLVQPLYDGFQGIDAINILRETHNDGEKYYWQIVSNAILTNSKFGELLVFVPYERELNEIRAVAHQSEGSEMSKFYGIAMSEDIQLPYLIEGGYYRNLNIIAFEVPEIDKQKLITAVAERGKLLEKKIEKP